MKMLVEWDEKKPNFVKERSRAGSDSVAILQSAATAVDGGDGGLIVRIDEVSKEEQKLNLKKNKWANTASARLWLKRIVSEKFVDAVKSKGERERVRGRKTCGGKDCASKGAFSWCPDWRDVLKSGIEQQGKEQNL